MSAEHDPWLVDAADFPSNRALPEQLRFLLNYAVLAPSGHNTQPWHFRVGRDYALLYADRTRALPVVDPHDRELTISCGAALHHLTTALVSFGLTATVELLPDASDTDLLARVTVTGRQEPVGDVQRLCAAILRRRTNRQRFADKALPAELLAACRGAAEPFGVWFQLIEGEEERLRAVDLIMAGDRAQAVNPSFRRELAAWMHPSRTRSRDGLVGYALGLGALESYVAPLLVRTFDWGNSQAAKDEQLVAGSPALAVLGSPDDTPAAWLQTGQALSQLLLLATAEGVSVSFFNQPNEVPELRPQLAALIGAEGYPQMLFRMGHGPEVRPSPRRPVDEVLLP